MSELENTELTPSEETPSEEPVVTLSRSAQLQRIVQSKIESLGYTGYADEAPDSAVYPYVVYNLGSWSYEDARDDIVLDVDVWDLGANYVTAEAMADDIEAEFTGDAVHGYESGVLPQFFRYLRTKVPDTDKKIKRINLKIQIQNYSHEAHLDPDAETVPSEG